MQIKILFSVLVVTVLMTDCNRVNVPDSVKVLFNKTFPDAQNVSWKKEKPLKYETSFVINGTEMSASYNGEGKWLETSQTIKQPELPVMVQSVLDSVYADYIVAGTSRVEKPDKIVLYKVELKKGDTQRTIQLEENGKVSQINTTKIVNAKD